MAIARNKRQTSMQGSHPARAKSKLETFRERNRVEQENYLCNKQKELANSQLAAEARKSLQAQSTRDQYDRYQEKFMEWCNASGYEGDYNVTKGKVTRYFACLTCETEDPINGIIRIKPLPKGKKGSSNDKSGEQRSILDGLCSDDVDGDDAEDNSDDDCEEGANQDIDINNSEENNEERCPDPEDVPSASDRRLSREDVHQEEVDRY
ncbi:MAG: hypothetical protein JOS17DRAFT_781513 [Linnemannia elongata]|nr:MAG: hypothetical protein JOS17DRAFT_781513 [Linnemannia elongata]